jgi:hypothetical protein
MLMLSVQYTHCHLMHHADAIGLLVAPAYISADMPLAQNEESHASLVYAWLLPQSSATPSMVSHTHSASASGVAHV